MSAPNFLFWLGWLLFDGCIWLRFGNHAIGRVPVLREARDFADPLAWQALFAVTALQIAFLAVQLARRSISRHTFRCGLFIAILPILGMFIEELFTYDFAVT